MRDGVPSGVLFPNTHVASWILFAVHRVTGRFMLKVPMVPKTRMPRRYASTVPVLRYKYEDEKEEERVLLAKLPSSIKAREMSLTLGKAILTIPAAGAGTFHALTGILLSHAKLDAGGDGHARLGHLLSLSCSPRLRRLRLRYVEGITELRLDAAAMLEELQLLRLNGLRSLDVAAPGLRVLACDHIGRVGWLRFDDNGTACLRSMEKLRLSSHRQIWLRGTGSSEDDGCDMSAATLWFLRHCTAVNRLGVQLELPWHQMVAKKVMNGEEVDYEDNMLQIPQLPHVSNLKIEVGYWPTGGHTIGATVAKFIAKCTEIENLSIDISYLVERCSDPNCFCSHPKGWEDQKLLLEHLTNIEIKGFLPFDSQIRLVQLLLASTTSLERMTLALQMLGVEGSEAVNFRIPCYGGRWVPPVLGDANCEWTRASDEGEEGDSVNLEVLPTVMILHPNAFRKREDFYWNAKD
uniref:FBD domain-containing protein n=1 Tax=Setaria viridis TaxID=4556 RepID=A0A4U6VL90_SETVI|nr:hypothetical protein SEVIR_3G366000v2 [Setaria viridis]